MATREADGLKQAPYHGDEGNKSLWYGEFAKSGVAQNDLIRMCVIPAGSFVTDMDFIFDDCGTTVTCDVGYEPVNSADGPSAVEDFWLAAVAVATAAGRSRSAAHAIRFEYDVYVTVKAEAAGFTGSPQNAGGGGGGCAGAT